MKKLIISTILVLAFLTVNAQNSSFIPNKDGIIYDSIHNTGIHTEYTGPCGCGNPMPAEEFNQFVSDIKVKGTDRNMLFFAKLGIAGKCLYAAQVEEIINLFFSYNTRVSFLYFCKPYTYDIGNYYALKIKYPTPYSIVPSGQLYNKNEVNAPNNPANNRKLNLNELNRNYISDGRRNEMQRDFYYFGYVR